MGVRCLSEMRSARDVVTPGRSTPWARSRRHLRQGVVSVKRHPLIAPVLLAGLLTVPASSARALPPTPAVTGATTRVSVTTAGAQANGRSEPAPGISGDGRYVTFASLASNLVAGDTNRAQDVFVRDRIIGTTIRVSLATAGTQANGHSYAPAISS